MTSYRSTAMVHKVFGSLYAGFIFIRPFGQFLNETSVLFTFTEVSPFSPTPRGQFCEIVMNDNLSWMTRFLSIHCLSTSPVHLLWILSHPRMFGRVSVTLTTRLQAFHGDWIHWKEFPHGVSLPDRTWSYTSPFAGCEEVTMKCGSYSLLGTSQASSASFLTWRISLDLVFKSHVDRLLLWVYLTPASVVLVPADHSHSSPELWLLSFLEVVLQQFQNHRRIDICVNFFTVVYPLLW